MFIENNQGFTCVHCSRQVPPHPTSSRNHCIYCLTSLHVDKQPGDRLNGCGGAMRPIGLEIRNGKTQIVFECKRCGERGKNIAAPDDNEDLIIDLSSKIL